MKHRVFTVIHLLDEKTMFTNVQISLDEGCDGFFLIDHGSGMDPIQAAEKVRERYSAAWIGVNLLGYWPDEAFYRLTPACSGLWADDARIDDRLSYQKEAHLIVDARVDSDWRGEYFGGVAHKASHQPRDAAAAAMIATSFMDVITTTGPGTGRPPTPDKVKSMREAIGEFPMALASGVTPENVGLFLPYVNDFLVATGISKDFHNLDQTKVRALVHNVRKGG